jgi:hypothetical protein
VEPEETFAVLVHLAALLAATDLAATLAHYLAPHCVGSTLLYIPSLR